ncbi:glycosyltransferase family 2 protein [Winogradskyella psychrotolerans]|uniref:glycosyltransferase family 2 protein n=1 Tax=Winogradskyella psychrotolerans TaxID=1344585 RepID=UPI001C076C8A|nr:glycosyltransferase family 2 protein [Winogradskyella psychrotolerans]MBU2919953.1 glycosyltransferase family 2 protein [Winogradskyella psychrotolerans]
MISVLIPVYNYNISELVSEIHKQLSHTDYPFEILCFDDCSNNGDLQEINKTINTFSYSKYVILPENIGRSAIRNQLAKQAKYDWCLFLDADVMPKHNNFIERYLEAISEKTEIIYGGILYQENRVNDSSLLRWIYGNEREALPTEQRQKHKYVSFLTLSFLIHKSVFQKVSFNEDIPNLRHEDTLFSYNLKEQNIEIEHIENPVYHLGIENSETFLQKSLDSVEAINLFVKQDLLPSDYTKITKVYASIKNNRISKLLSAIYVKHENTFRKNLLGKKPSLKFFDLYRLTYYCYINSKK